MREQVFRSEKFDPQLSRPQVNASRKVSDNAMACMGSRRGDANPGLKTSSAGFN
jgi:hypothetical protein